MLTRNLKMALASVMVTATLPGAALADFPERNIENIFPWAGGVVQAVSQIIADAMGEELGVAIPVISTPGGGGVKAFETALAKPADGYTIFDGYVAPLVFAPLLGNAEWSYDDFIPLYSATSNAFSIIVRRDDDRFQTLDDLIAYMKENPGQARYTSGSPNNNPHLQLANVLYANDIYGRVIPYPELEQGVKDMRGGVLDFMMSNPGFYKTNSEHVRALVVISDQPEASEWYDGAPLITDTEFGENVHGLAPLGWNWWLVHKDTPADRVEILRAAMAAALARGDVRERILATGFVPTGYTPDQYDEIVGPVVDEIAGALAALEWVLEKQ